MSASRRVIDNLIDALLAGVDATRLSIHETLIHRGLL
jgi:hypothetical protein